MTRAQDDVPEEAPDVRQVGLVVLLGAVMALATLLSMALGVIAPFLVEDLHLSTASVGVLTSLMYLSGALASPLVGRVADMAGARRGLLLLLGTVLASLVLVGGSPGAVVLGVGVLVGGASLAAANPVTNRAVAELLPEGRRGAAMGWKQAGVPAAAFVAGAILPTLADAWGWRRAVLALAPLPVIAAVATIRRVSASTVVRRSVRRPDVFTVGAELRRLNAYAFFMGAAGGAMTTYAVLYAVDESGVTPTMAGMIAAASGAAGVAARVLWGRLGEDRDDSLALLALLGGGALVSSLIYALGPVMGVGALWVGSVLVGVSLNSWQPLAMMALVGWVPLRQLGAASGVVMRAFYGGYLVGPVLFGVLADRVGYSAAWVSEIAVCLVATVVVLPRARAAHTLPSAESS